MLGKNIEFLAILIIFAKEVLCFNIQTVSVSPSDSVAEKKGSTENSSVLSPESNLIPINSAVLESLVKISTCCHLNRSIVFEGKNGSKDHCRNRPSFHQDSNSVPTSSIWTIPENLLSTNDESMDVMLKYKNLICPLESIQVSLPWNSSDRADRLYLFYTNGYLKISNESTTDYYAPDEYCINGFTEEGVDVRLCSPDCGNIRPCIPKCCPLDHVYGFGVTTKKDGSKVSRGCIRPKGINDQGTNMHFNPPLYHDFYTQLSKEEISQAPLPHYFLWRQSNFKYNCPLNKTTVVPISPFVAENVSQHFGVPMYPLDFRIRKDGAFIYKNEAERKCYTRDDPKHILCFDSAQDFSVDQEYYKNTHEEMIIFTCTVWGEILSPDRKNLVYGILMITFSIFPLITSIIYISLWFRQNVHGWTIAATTGTLFFMYIFQGLAFLLGEVYGREITEYYSCTIIAISAHFFFLATFSWLTVMCCDLWWTFRSLTPTNRRSKGMKRFVKYSLFGWGVPAIIVSVGIILDHTYAYDCTNYIVPGYGSKSCWIIDESQGVYVYYPVAIMLSLNMIFFGITSFKLCRYRQNTKFATKKEASIGQSLSRFTKLFLVMGVSWVFELISWSIHGNDFRWYWIIFDVLNILRAVGIFVVYVCKPDIVMALEDSHPCLKRVFGHFKRRCSDDLSSMTGSTTAAISPTSQQFPNAQTSTL